MPEKPRAMCWRANTYEFISISVPAGQSARAADRNVSARLKTIRKVVRCGVLPSNGTAAERAPISVNISIGLTGMITGPNCGVPKRISCSGVRFPPRNFQRYLKHICPFAGAAMWRRHFGANIRNELWIGHGSAARWASTLQMNRNKRLSLNKCIQSGKCDFEGQECRLKSDGCPLCVRLLVWRRWDGPDELNRKSRNGFLV